MGLGENENHEVGSDPPILPLLPRPLENADAMPAEKRRWMTRPEPESGVSVV
jgi:hypothetical protein